MQAQQEERKTESNHEVADSRFKPFIVICARIRAAASGNDVLCYQAPP